VLQQGGAGGVDIVSKTEGYSWVKTEKSICLFGKSLKKQVKQSDA